jgi:hypothetical protein
LIHQRLGEQDGCTHLSLRQNSIGHCTFPIATVVARSSCFIKRLLCGECPNESTQSLTDLPDCSGLVGVSAVTATDAAFRMYPNPSGGAVTLSLDAAPSGVRQVRIGNMWGQTLLTAIWTGADPLTLPLDGLSAGIYIVTLEDADGRATAQRLVKQ